MAKLADMFYLKKLMDEHNSQIWISNDPPSDQNTYKVWYKPDTNELFINGVKVVGGDSADKFYRQEFINTDEVTVSHQLNKFPSVTVVDTAGTIFECQVDYIDLNNLKVIMTKAMSGFIYCN